MCWSFLSTCFLARIYDDTDTDTQEALHPAVGEALLDESPALYTHLFSHTSPWALLPTLILVQIYGYLNSGCSDRVRDQAHALLDARPDLYEYVTVTIDRVDDWRPVNPLLVRRLASPICYEHLSERCIKTCINLTHLDIWSCPRAMVDDLQVLINFTHLKLHGCSRLTVAGLKHLINLTHLELFDCPLVTDEELDGLVNLTRLRLHKCPRVSVEYQQAHSHLLDY